MSAIIREETIGPCRLILGDCLEVLPLIGKVDAVVTDPPYGINLGKTAGTGGSHGMSFEAYEGYEDTYENFVNEIVPRLNAALDATTRGLVWTGPHIHEQRKPNVIGGVYCPSGAGRHGWGFKTFLPFLLYGNGPDIHLGAPFPTTLQSTEKPTPNGHPCPKPIGWMVWNVELTSRDGSTILDPFMGSGTTGVACIRTGRKFIGIEREEKYFTIAVKRIEREWRLKRSEIKFEPEPSPVQLSLINE
jgi:site-specific DNA-methyltransferase (adenine-specific)